MSLTSFNSAFDLTVNFDSVVAHLGDASVFFPSSLLPFPPPGDTFKFFFFIWIWLGVPQLAKSYLLFFLHIRKDYFFAWKGCWWRSNKMLPGHLPFGTTYYGKPLNQFTEQDKVCLLQAQDLYFATCLSLISLNSTISWSLQASLLLAITWLVTTSYLWVADISACPLVAASKNTL